MLADGAVESIKHVLSDPERVLSALDMLGQGKSRSRQARGFMIRCPSHEERSPSCSVQNKDGMLVWKCWGCGATGDVLSLVAIARGLNIGTDFKRVLVEGARLAGLWQLVDQLEGREPKGPVAPYVPPPRPAPEPPREWPPQSEVDALWGSCVGVTRDDVVAAYLRDQRKIDPDMVEYKELARALPMQGALPSWACMRFGSWRDAGYRLIVATLDCGGILRSLRCWRVTQGEGPKRLPPSGHKAGEMVMADVIGCKMLRGEEKPQRVIITEGESDFLSRALVTNDPHAAVLGIVSGSWTKEFAKRIPVGAHVAIRTDPDDAGNRYANEIRETIKRHAFMWRLEEGA